MRGITIDFGSMFRREQKKSKLMPTSWGGMMFNLILLPVFSVVLAIWFLCIDVFRFFGECCLILFRITFTSNIPVIFDKRKEFIWSRVVKSRISVFSLRGIISFSKYYKYIILNLLLISTYILRATLEGANVVAYDFINRLKFTKEIFFLIQISIALLFGLIRLLDIDSSRPDLVNIFSKMLKTGHLNGCRYDNISYKGQHFNSNSNPDTSRFQSDIKIGDIVDTMQTRYKSFNIIKRDLGNSVFYHITCM